MLIEHIKHNWKSGMTVALVSIPLSVSLAVASGTAPVVGIVTAIWAGIIHSCFGGSRFNIVGPTGALSGILAAFALNHGANMLPMLAIVSGVYILIAYALKLERYFSFIPASTVHGFTLGVAVIIGCNQFNFAIGLKELEKHPHFIQNVLESLQHIHTGSLSTFLIFLSFLILLFLLARFLPRVPGAIILAPIGIALGYGSQMGFIPLSLETLGENFSNMSAALFIPFRIELSKPIISTAATVAIVAILETMISAKIADGMTKTKHNRRKEILGLALANIGSGIAGGIPATAALARTALNIKTHATHNTSAAISAMMVALISFVFLSYFSYIPLAVIAAILVFTAVKMVEVRHFFRMAKHDTLSFGIAVLVAGITIYEDPIIGILVGTSIMLLIFMHNLSKGQFELLVNNEQHQLTDVILGEADFQKINKESNTFVYSIKGQLAYINAQAHISRFEMHLSKKYKTVVLRLRELYFIDLDGVDAFDEIVDLIRADGKEVMITGTNAYIGRMLENDSEAYRTLKKEKKVFEHTADALRSLGFFA